jgi:hypothetical protein
MAPERKGVRHPPDVNARASTIPKIDTKEIEESSPPHSGKNKAAQELGRMGGKARAEGLSAKRRQEIARNAAKSRWKS